jgi:hypothetical protein
VTHDESRNWTAQQLRNAAGGPLDRETVKAVTADTPILAPGARQRVFGCLRRDGAVKRGVEDGDVRKIRERELRLVDCLQGGSIVKRRKRNEVADLATDDLVDHNGIHEARAAVDDTVRNRLDLVGDFLE